ncbi:MAG TPA: hypothetical protein VHC44_08655 [Verrucomicrobiae bacterium]|nr:hypothetical protein [Verrucomicrobiae bacterium]
MNQLNAQPPAPATVVTNPAPKKAVAKPAPATKPAPPVVTVKPQPATVENPPAQPAPKISQPATPAPGYVSTPSNDAATSDKLTEALHQKMQEAGTETPAPAVVTQKPARSMTAPAQPETKSAMEKPAPTPAPTPAPATPGNFAPLPEGTTRHPALPEQPTPAPTPVMSQNEPAQPTISLPALTGPPSPLSPAKQQKLDELLQQYRADQLTPQQYHEQRAKILAEP